MTFSFLFYEPVPDLAELDRRMAVLAGLGYRGIELSASHPAPYPVERIAGLAEQHGLSVVSMLSGWSYANERLCLSSPDRAVRDQAVARLAEYVSQVARLGAVLVVGLMQGLRHDEPDEARANDRIVEALRRVGKAAEDQGATIVIEPVNHLQVGFNHSAAEAAALADRIGSNAVRIMLDTLHMNIEERNVIETIRRFGSRIGHFHLCETNGGPFGSGGLDFDGVMAALREVGYAGAVSMKVYRKSDWETAARSSAAFLRRGGVWEWGGRA